MPIRILAAGLLVASLACGSLWAQGGAPEPTREQVEAQLSKFRSERAEAQKLKFPPKAYTQADRSLQRAEQTLQAEDYRSAARHARNARWQLPALPGGLPKQVSMVIGAVRLRHADRVNGLAYSPDGQRIASASRDGTVRIWDLGNGRELLAYREHPQPEPVDDDKPIDASASLRVTDVVWSPLGSVVASSCANEVHLWNPDTGKRVHTLKGHKQMVTSLAFSADGKRLVSGGDDNIAIVWDVETGKETYTTPAAEGRVEAVAFSKKRGLIGLADASGTVTVYDPSVENPKPLVKTTATEGNKQQATCLTFFPDDSKLLAGGVDREARILAGPAVPGGSEPPAADALLKFSGHTDTVSGVAVTTDGLLVVTGSYDRTIRVWDANSGKQIRLYQGHLEKVTSLAMRPDGRQVASGSEDGRIFLWDISSVDEHVQVGEAKDSLWAVAYAPDGSRMAVAGADRLIRVYDAAGKLTHTLKGHSAAITSLVFVTPERLASAGGDRVIKLWNAADGTHERDLTGHTSAILALGTLGNGTLLSASADKSARAWDLAEGKARWTWEGHSTACAIAGMADGSRVAVGTADGSLFLLDPRAQPVKATGNLVAHMAGVAAVAFEPQSNRLATVGGDGQVKIWSVLDNGAIVPSARYESALKASTPGGVTALSTVNFSPNGRQVVTAGADGIVRIWNASTGAEVRALRGHTDWVTSAVFSPDGEKLLSASVDRTARLFDLSQVDTSGQVAHAQAVRAITISPDGRQIASGADDKTVKLWNLATGEETATLTGATDRIFTMSFVGPDKIAAGTGSGDRRVRLWQLPQGKELKATMIGETFLLLGQPEGEVLVWSRNASEHHEFGRLSAELALKDDPLTDKARTPTCATFAHDGSRVAIGSEDGTVRFWKLADKQRDGKDWELFPTYVADVGLANDGKTLYAISGDGQLVTGDITKRDILHKATSKVTLVNALVVGPKGERCAVIGSEGRIELYDRQGKEIDSWLLPVPANTAAFTPDGKQLVTGNGDGTIYILDLP